MLMLALLSLTVLSGCSNRPAWVSKHDADPLIDRYGNARSLVLSTPLVNSAQLLPPQYDPWYASRNDRGPYVTLQTSDVETSVTYTRDRQYISNGRVYDRYDQTTYRRTYRGSTR